VVDDRAENLLALEAILEPLGQTLVRANSGPQALRCVLEAEFATILLDVQMPGMNGFEVAEIIKSREKSRTIPIIFLSAISKEDAYVFKGYSMGAVDYVFKPFNPDVLRSKVAVFVDLFVKQRELQHQAELLRDAEKRELELEHRTSLLETEAREAGKIELSLQPVMFPSLIEDLFVTVRPLADEYGSTLTLEMDAEPFNIVSDPRRVRQILLNLLSNAIKFGEGKPIRVTCKQNDE